MNSSDTQPDLVHALSDPRAYPDPPPRVECIQTHISFVFLAGENVYKVKKCVRFPFLDYSTLERRKHFCHEEVRLNQPLAGDVYRGVVPITLEKGIVQVDGPGETIDYAVWMRRLKEEDLLPSRLEKGLLHKKHFDAIALHMARFHRSARRDPETQTLGAWSSLEENARQNFEETRRGIATSPFDEEGPWLAIPELHHWLENESAKRLRDLRELADDRSRRGRICDGHGDVHCGNVCIEGENRITIYDRIEFSPDFRCGDVALEIAFLAMDLDSREHQDFSNSFVESYSRHESDPEILTLMGPLKSYRAMVRAKIERLSSLDERVVSEERRQHRKQARHYFSLAASYLLPPSAVMSCGLPASGKSTLALRLAKDAGFKILDSDLIRKEMAGIEPTEHPKGEEARRLYSGEMTQRVYQELIIRALASLRMGRSVFIDATFSKESWRAPFIEALTNAGFGYLFVWFDVPETEIERRMEKRRLESGVISDADISVYLKLKEEFEPPRELSDRNRLDIHGKAFVPSVAIQQVLSRLGEFLLRQ